MSRRRQELLRPARITALARRISSSGLAIVLVLILAMGVIVERSILSSWARSAIRALPSPSVPIPTFTPSRPKPAKPVSLPLSMLTADVQKITMSQMGDAARRAYGGRAAGPPVVALAHADVGHEGHAHSWAMGTTAIPVPAGDGAAPQVNLFVAHVTDGHWKVALAGTDEFDDLLSTAPASVVPAAQRHVLAHFGSTSPNTSPQVTGPSGLMLPWKIGESWSMQSAAGGLDFAGKSGRVLAAGPGWLYRFCTAKPGRGLVLLIHPNGLATTYYQMTGIPDLPDGSPVKVGDYLGKIGTDLPCGGVASPKPAVRFGLSDGDLDGATIGGWTFHAQTLSGYAEHGTKKIVPGGLLDNFGSPPMTIPPAPTPTPTPTSPTPLVPGLPIPAPSVPQGNEASP